MCRRVRRYLARAALPADEAPDPAPACELPSPVCGVRWSDRGGPEIRLPWEKAEAQFFIRSRFA
jgi:hypothetical protein